MELTVPLQVILALALGGIIGLEREINEKKHLVDSNKTTAILGLRTFSLTAGLGAIAGVFFFDRAIISAILSIGVVALIIAFYALDTYKTKDLGITTEIALLYSFVIGFLLTTKTFPVMLTIALTVILTLLLSRKENIKNFVSDIQKREMNAFVSFAILAFVILPFLPNQTYALSDIPSVEHTLKNFSVDVQKTASIEILNPFKLWLVVVLITAIDLAGYFLERTIGQKKGWIIASTAGGFISSTATTISLAKESRESPATNTLLAGTLFANAVSFIPIVFIITALNFEFLRFALPTLLILIVGTFLLGLFFLVQKDKKEHAFHKRDGKTKIIDLIVALRFAGLFLVVSVISKIGLEVIGTGGFLVASALGAIPGIDAVVINTAQLAGDRVDYSIAIWALIIINAVNFATKAFYSLTQGKREYAVKLSVSLGVVVLASLAGLLFA